MGLMVLCASPAGFAGKDFIPIIIAVIVFVSNVIYQEVNRRNNVRDRISGEVVSICDKMIRYAVEAEQSAIMMRFWNKVLQLYPLKAETSDGNKEDNKNAQLQSTYYHKKLEDAGLNLDLLKSELKKHTSDLQKYWGHELNARIVLRLMSVAVLKDPRRFDKILNKAYSSVAEIEEECSVLGDGVIREVAFNGIGYELIRIQKIIDPKSPTLLLTHEQEAELLKKIAQEDCYRCT